MQGSNVRLSKFQQRLSFTSEPNLAIYSGSSPWEFPMNRLKANAEGRSN